VQEYRELVVWGEDTGSGEIVDRARVAGDLSEDSAVWQVDCILLRL